ncbi:MAG: hypothetical protein HYY18_17425 [Planctomycetes bacterium]|nr:hypothetical protein [Planctomycetota bacterium]
MTVGYGPLPESGEGFSEDILLWDQKGLTPNQSDDSSWIPVRRANRFLVGGVWLYAGAAVTLNFALFGSADGENEFQIGTWQVTQLGAWWAAGLPVVNYEFVKVRVLNGNTDSILARLFTRALQS